MHQIIEYCNSFTVTRPCCTPMYRQGVISKNDKFQTIGFHSSSHLNQFTSSNKRRRGHQVCVEAKTIHDSLVSLDLNPTEQLWDELWRCIRDPSLQPWNLRQPQVAPLRMGLDSLECCETLRAFNSTSL